MNRLILCLSDYRSTEDHTYHSDDKMHTYYYAIRQVVRLIATNTTRLQQARVELGKLKRKKKKDLMSDH